MHIQKNEWFNKKHLCPFQFLDATSLPRPLRQLHGNIYVVYCVNWTLAIFLVSGRALKEDEKHLEKDFAIINIFMKGWNIHLGLEGGCRLLSSLFSLPTPRPGL